MQYAKVQVLVKLPLEYVSQLALALEFEIAPPPELALPNEDRVIAPV